MNWIFQAFDKVQFWPDMSSVQKIAAVLSPCKSCKEGRFGASVHFRGSNTTIVFTSHFKCFCIGNDLLGSQFSLKEANGKVSKAVYIGKDGNTWCTDHIAMHMVALIGLHVLGVIPRRATNLSPC